MVTEGVNTEVSTTSEAPKTAEQGPQGRGSSFLRGLKEIVSKKNLERALASLNGMSSAQGDKRPIRPQDK